MLWKKLKFISSYSLETNKTLFRTFLGIEIDVLDNFSIKNDRSFEIVKYPSLDHGALGGFGVGLVTLGLILGLSF